MSINVDVLALRDRLVQDGVAAWNTWRQEHPTVKPHLYGAHLTGAKLSGVNLSRATLNQAFLMTADLSAADLSKAHLDNANLTQANLDGANLSDAFLGNADLSEVSLVHANLGKAQLSEANLSEANLSEANLAGANLSRANLSRANLSKANLRGASLAEVQLYGADLTNADLSGAHLVGANLMGTTLHGARLSSADLTRAICVGTDFSDSELSGCTVYGVAAWDLQLGGAVQTDLRITPYGKPSITVDRLDVAQFIYLLLHNPNIRQVIDTIATKLVLILGRFSPERKAVLDALREDLRRRNYLPVVFDFEGPSNRDLTETISLLAHLARFVIADLTDPRSVPQELTAIIPSLPSVPVQPIIHASGREYAMFEHWRNYPWVLPIYQYQDSAALEAAVDDLVVGPAEARIRAQAELRNGPAD